MIGDELALAIDEYRGEGIRDLRRGNRIVPSHVERENSGIGHGLHLQMREQLRGTDRQPDALRDRFRHGRLLDEFRVGFRALNAVRGEQGVEDRKVRAGIGLRRLRSARTRVAAIIFTCVVNFFGCSTVKRMTKSAKPAQMAMNKLRRRLKTFQIFCGSISRAPVE